MKALLQFFKKKNKLEVDKEADIRQCVLSSDSKFPVVEAYKSARTNLMYALAGEEGSKKIVFTSSMPADGKTTTCVNTAITFAQTGERVALIDADLRKPKVHKLLDLPNKHGLANYLGGLAKMEDIIVHDDAHKLDVICAGRIPPNPSELLSSPKMAAFLEEIAKSYDYVFIDMPPVNVVTDALSVAKYVTGVVIVVRERYTNHDALKKSVESLQFTNAKILGFILNAVEERGVYYSKSGKFGRGSKYGYYYSEAKPK